MMARISSRMGHCRLVFTPYKSSEIQKIIEQRLEKIKGVFEAKAVKYISKKVASVSSDIRKTLSICRQTVQKLQADIERSKKEGKFDENNRPKVGIQLVMRTFKEAYKSPLLEYIQSATEATKTWLACLKLELSNSMLNSCDYGDLYARFSIISQTYDIPKYSYQEMKLVVNKLVDIGVVEIKTSKKLRTEEIYLVSNIDELSYCLRNNEIIKRFSNEKFSE